MTVTANAAEVSSDRDVCQKKKLIFFFKNNPCLTGSISPTLECLGLVNFSD